MKIAVVLALLVVNLVVADAWDLFQRRQVDPDATNRTSGPPPGEPRPRPSGEPRSAGSGVGGSASNEESAGQSNEASLERRQVDPDVNSLTSGPPPREPRPRPSGEPRSAGSGVGGSASNEESAGQSNEASLERRQLAPDATNRTSGPGGPGERPTGDPRPRPSDEPRPSGGPRPSREPRPAGSGVSGSASDEGSSQSNEDSV